MPYGGTFPGNVPTRVYTQRWPKQQKVRWSLENHSKEIMLNNLKFNTSGDENHLCGASLRKGHKISLKAHRHACAHGVGTPIARPEKLPQQ